MGQQAHILMAACLSRFHFDVPCNFVLRNEVIGPEFTSLLVFDGALDDHAEHFLKWAVPRVVELLDAMNLHPSVHPPTNLGDFSKASSLLRIMMPAGLHDLLQLRWAVFGYLWANASFCHPVHELVIVSARGQTRGHQASQIPRGKEE